MVYLDHNATTPLDPEVRAEMDACLDRAFGNPGSIHAFGQQARRMLDRARLQAARLIGAEPHEIVFTSGGTEADNLALLGAVAARPERRHVIASPIEHQAVLNPCHHLEAMGCEVTWVRVGRDGRVVPPSVTAALRDDTALVSIMLANNETGVLQPVPLLARAVHARGALFHTDAVQAVGKLPLSVRELEVDLLSFSGHKIHGPKGVGALYVRAGIPLSPILFGGRQERGLRPGTENVPAIVGFGKACELAAARLAADSLYLARLRDAFEEGVTDRIAGTRVNGRGVPRLSNTSNILFPGLDAGQLTVNLDLLGLAVSTGSACNASDRTPSHVLMAMGWSEAEARSTLRFSFGRTNTLDDVAIAIECVCQATAALGGCR